VYLRYRRSYDDCGFDISHNNAGLNFGRLAGEGRRKYCFVKLTEGGTFRDPNFVTNVAGLIGAGIDRIGVYHFAHHGDPMGQMRFFISSFVDLTRNIVNKPDFLFMLDLEPPANPPQETDGLTMVHFLQSIGINPMIYCGFDFWSSSPPELAACTHMVAAYNNHPTSAVPWRLPSADTYGWDMWQYTGDALGPFARDIPGGSHGMDLSCFNLKKHPTGLASWWDDQLSHTRQPTSATAPLVA
jgi:GH25 family lysozyme M1 (1,4-beta-N-acetylmuramidase)